jgi:hypothetical protein
MILHDSDWKYVFIILKHGNIIFGTDCISSEL